MNRFELQKLRDLPIEGVAERLGLRVERHKCLCPFHDDHTPSLTFRNNKYKCWSCGESGDTISLVMKLLPSRGGREGSFKEACQWLSLTPSPSPVGEGNRSGRTPLSHGRGDGGEAAFDASRYEKYFEHPFLNAEARHFLFEERKLDERVVRWCRLTSWRDKQGVPWLQIPYYNREGKLIGVQNRRLKSPSNFCPPSHSLPNCSATNGQLPVKGDLQGQDSLPLREGWGGSSPRFRFPRGSQCGIYNLPVLNLLKPGDELYIAEGCSDCWSLLSAGHKAIAIPSATLLTREVVEQLSIINSQLSISLHMFPDRDAPGERLFLQLKEVLPNLVHHQLPQGCKDFSEYYVKTLSGSPLKGEETNS